MDKHSLLAQLITQLQHDLDLATAAADSAHADATHAESVAETQYDTLGLEASYLAAGHSRRVDELRSALQRLRVLQIRERDEAIGIQLTSLIWLENPQGQNRCLFLLPEGAGVSLGEVTVITPQAPLGRALLGAQIDDELHVGHQDLQVIDYR